MCRRCSIDMIASIAAMPIALVAGALLFFVPAPSSDAFELEAQLDGVVDNVHIESDPTSGDSAPYSWHEDVLRPHSEYIRLHVASVDIPANTAASLALRDQTGAIVRRYTIRELQELTPFWTVAVTGDHAQIVVEGDRVPDGFQIVFDKIAYQTEAGAPLSTYGNDRKQPIRDYLDDRIVSEIQSAVAKLLFIKDGLPRVCTGFLFENDLLLTNHHCISDQATCDTAVALFGYQVTPDGRLEAGEQYECLNIDDEKVDYELDYAVVRLARSPGMVWGHLELAGVDPVSAAADASDEENLGLFVVQHPAGYPKMISYKGCGSTAAPVDGRSPGSDFTHRCDTLGGSSGSPIVDLQGRVVGLHHYGFGDGEGQADAWHENRAVRMSRIVPRLEIEDIDCP
ncbi:MAG: serine protease [Proteobacteria bacterium]|nr:MAG: serine protease [Pseudomonadota bacterium]